MLAAEVGGGGSSLPHRGKYVTIACFFLPNLFFYACHLHDGRQELLYQYLATSYLELSMPCKFCFW